MLQSRPLHAYVDAIGPLVQAQRLADCPEICFATPDSRQVRPGALFVAIKGACQDGTAFVPAAIKAGAVAVVAGSALELPEEVAFIQVSDDYAAAARLAECTYGYPARVLRMVGITGTNGKTTCAYLLREMLARAGRRTGLVGTVEYCIGDQVVKMAERTTPTPFELQELLSRMVDAGVQDAILEISSHALAQQRAGTAAFAGAMFTNLTGDHLDYHGTMEGYYAAKRMLFTGYLREGSRAVVNVDDPYGARLFKDLPGACEGVGFGTSPGADAVMQDMSCSVEGGSVQLRTSQGLWPLHTPMIGRHNLYNVVGTALLARELGVPQDAIAEAVAAFRGARGRLEPIAATNGVCAFVDYAHTDDALANVLEALRELKPRRLSVLFGCGGDRDRTKRPRMGRVAQKLADQVYITSDNPRTEDPVAILEDIRAGLHEPARHCVVVEDRRDALRRALAEAGAGDIVLVAGKGHETYQEIDGVKHPFDDVCEVRKAMQELGISGDSA